MTRPPHKFSSLIAVVLQNGISDVGAMIVVRVGEGSGSLFQVAITVVKVGEGEITVWA